jgi:hypothetical protein
MAGSPLPGVAMISHWLLTRFLDLTPPMTAFILVGTIALSAVQVCQLDVAYAVLFDIWSKSMKHQFLTPVRIHHLALGSWLVGVGRGVIVWGLMALIGSRAFGFDFVGAGAPRVAMFLLGCFMTALVIGLLVCALVLLFGTRAETSAWAAYPWYDVVCGGGGVASSLLGTMSVRCCVRTWPDAFGVVAVAPQRDPERARTWNAFAAASTTASSTTRIASSPTTIRPAST